MSARGDSRKLLRELRQQGWKIEGGGGHHYKLTPPSGGRPHTVSCSPTDPRVPTYLAELVKKARRG